MEKYLIHTCNQRLWYVKDYLIPSMVMQGIDENAISIYLDTENDGCLEACMKAFLSVPNNNSSTWHLQDDIIVCSDFKDMTEKFYSCDVVCGYCYAFDGNKDKVGYVTSKDMWYSFPCIKIPNKIARKCANWYFNKVKHDDAYRLYVQSKRHDDTLFHMFMEDYFFDTIVLNLVPNIVDHVDYLIGGSITNKIRPEKETHAAHFIDSAVLENLEKILRNNS